MKLTPDDIMNQNFSNKAVGFNKDEVRAFLEIVAGEFEELANENSLLKKELSEKDDRGNMMSETRGEVKEIYGIMQQFGKDYSDLARQNSLLEQKLMKRNDEIINAVNTMSGAGIDVRGLMDSIQGLKERFFAMQASAENVSKDDLKRFISTINKIKEDELEKAEERTAQIISEAHHKAKEMAREAEGIVEGKKEEASLVINEAHQRSEEMIREAQNEAEKMRERAAQTIKDAQQRGKEVVRDAENQAEKMREEAGLIVRDAQQRGRELIKDAENQSEKMKGDGALIVKDAQQRGRELIKDAENQMEKMKGEGSLVIRDAQQKAGTIIREAKNEEEKIRIAILDLKKQHRLFENRIKEAIEFHMTLLSSVDQGEAQGQEKEEEEAQEKGNALAEHNSFSPFAAPKG